MRPLGLVKQFHNLFITIEFDLFGFLNLEILNFEVRSSTVFQYFNLITEFRVMDNVQISD